MKKQESFLAAVLLLSAMLLVVQEARGQGSDRNYILTRAILDGQGTAYSYNVRGWLTRVAGDRFNQALAYNEAVNGITPSTPLYGGNISAMTWKAGGRDGGKGLPVRLRRP